VHNYAYPSVASWLQSTSLADLEGTADPSPADPSPVDDALDASPDDFYKTPYITAERDLAPAPLDMAASRQRQPATNGAARPAPKTTPRSASGPASSSAATRASPHVANKVKALAERFERSPGSAAGTAPAMRSRSKEPTRAGAHDGVKRPTASVSSTASAARPSKEAAYGAYKFNNLKPRERPQPAPAAPRSATRRTAGSISSLDQQISPTRRKVASPAGRPVSGGRQPFFGEVVRGQDVASPGFGIPALDGTVEEVPGVDTIMEALGDGGARLPATTFSSPQHERAAGGGATSTFAREGSRAQPAEPVTMRSPRRPSPTSRIPVATRRLSATSDTSSSTSHSVRYTPTRASTRSNRASPTKMYRTSLSNSFAAEPRGAEQAILPALAYRGYRERGKSPMGPRDKPSVPAVVTASLPPASPRLRNSRERQSLQPSPGASSSCSSPHGHGYFTNERVESQYALSPNLHEASRGDFPPQPLTSQGLSPSSHDTHQHPEQSAQGEGQGFSAPHQRRPSLQTSHMSLPPSQQRVSTLTDFEESPVLGVPGSFILTPPTAHEDPRPELLQPKVFHPWVNEKAYKSPDIEQSELGSRESIPIMLSEHQSSRPWHSTSEDIDGGLQALSYGYQPERGYGDELRDSPIDPLPNRDTLRPDDSASIGPHRSVGPLAFNSETYSVVNSVLNLYHQSPVISPELASISRARVQQVSPVFAQHKDWASKEATETYLARLLSDANGTGSDALGDLSRLSRRGDEMPNYELGGTAIIYPPESRRYSRGSGGSTTTTIQDDASRSGSSSGKRSHDLILQHSPTGRTPASTNGIELPQLAWTNGGLGLSYHEPSPPSPSSQHAPPRPAYSPPPPPAISSKEQHAVSLDASLSSYSHQYPRPAIADERNEQHPARAQTPVNQLQDQGLEAHCGAPQPLDGTPHATPSRGMPESEQPDPAKLALIKRYRILEELLTTEHQFCIDMMIAHNIFEATAESVMSDREKKVLFSNCKELEKFSLSLFRAFKKAAKPIVNYDIPPPTGPWSRDSMDSRPSNPSDTSLNVRRPSEDSQNQFENCTPENDHLTTIGQVFLDNKEKMERLYTTYFLNQDNAANYMKKKQGNSELTGWVIACFEQVENMTQAWDLDSLLLKPCQRLLKYPLLLEGLETSCDPDHPDLPNIKAARKELIAISTRINDAKKRSDTFRAATSEGKKEKTKGKGIGKTFVKAFIPKVDKNKAYDEADRYFKDLDYKSREQKFGGHFFQLQIVIRDFEQYLDAITEHYQQLNIVFLQFVTVSEVGPSVNPELESTWRKWAMAHFELQNKALEEHVSYGTVTAWFVLTFDRKLLSVVGY
jgi:hypothetical protein